MLRLWSAVVEGDELIIGFGQGEELRISEPANWEFDEHTFRVQKASRVVWSWYSYGLPHRPENLCTIEHRLDDEGAVHVSVEPEWHRPATEPSAIEAAAELL